MALVWSNRAQDDRKRIARYITEQGNEQAAHKLDTEIAARAEQTAASGITIRHKAGRVPGTHEIVVRPNYIIVYRATKTKITVLRVIHASQQWPRK